MTRIFVSKPNEGWKEFEIPEHYKPYSYDDIVGIVHTFLDSKNYKGLLITENPNPF